MGLEMPPVDHHLPAPIALDSALSHYRPWVNIRGGPDSMSVEIPLRIPPAGWLPGAAVGLGVFVGFGALLLMVPQVRAMAPSVKVVIVFLVGTFGLVTLGVPWLVVQHMQARAAGGSPGLQVAFDKGVVESRVLGKPVRFCDLRGVVVYSGNVRRAVGGRADTEETFGSVYVHQLNLHVAFPGEEERLVCAAVLPSRRSALRVAHVLGNRAGVPVRHVRAGFFGAPQQLS
jgi:hypothetical protein